MMVRIQGFVAALLATLILVVPARVTVAGDASSAEIEQLKKDVEKLRRQLSESSTAMPRSNVDKMVEGKYGPNSNVTTRAGRLSIGGLLQVWMYTVQNDHEGMFNDPNGTGVFDTNEASDNDSFRIRRAELSFTMDIHENVQAVVRIDPAAEAVSFPNMPVNSANNGVFKSSNNVAPEYDAANGPGLGNTATVGNVQTGAGRVPRLLRDAYINYHGVVPHHDFTVGQFRPQIGEEGVRDSGKLDFIERSMIGQLTEARDLGVQAHGFWWDDRLQYWLGAFDAAGGYLAPYRANRSDDNDYKDFLATIMVRPLWKDECWGSIELGYSIMGGKHGESGARDPINTPINGLNRSQSWALRHAAWASYHMGGPVRGWWIRGEWQRIKDRNAPGTVVDLLAAGGTDIGNTGSGSGLGQSNGGPLTVQGWYISTGYRLTDSCVCDSSPSWLKPWEFAFRYEAMQNIMVADLVVPGHTDVFKTQVYTAGLNYYIKGHNAKIQANYNWVLEPAGDHSGRGFGSVHNDSFMVNFQVAF